MLNKEKVYLHYSALLNEKMEDLQKVLDDLKESAANETKSTAGDKHETALAMLQIDQANKRAQMQELLTQKAVLNKINPSLSTIQVMTGSLVQTDKTYYFVSVALGKSVIEAETVIALSALSPLGKAMAGLKKNQSFLFNGQPVDIIDIC